MSNIFTPIYWNREASKTKLESHEDFNDLLDFWDEKGYIRAKEGGNTDRARFIDLEKEGEGKDWGIYFVDTKSDKFKNAVYLCTSNNDQRNYSIYYPPKSGGSGGSIAWKRVNSNARVIEHYGAIYREKTPVAFTVVNTVKHNLGGPIVVNFGEMHRFYENCWKADISSAYPSVSQNLPTARDMQVINKFVEPTVEYPFAFYSTGDIKILEEDGTIIDSSFFNTTWFHPKRPDRFRPCTVLMKRAKSQSLYEYFDYLYSQRSVVQTEKEQKDIKAVLNYSIGFMGSAKWNTWGYCGHISAVIYARHINRMLNHINDLTAHNDKILMVLTDSIIFQGDYNPYDKQKALGKMVFEDSGTVILRKQGQYAFCDDDYNLRLDTVHTQAISEEVKQYISYPLDFWNMGEIAKKHGFGIQWRFNKITWRYEEGEEHDYL